MSPRTALASLLATIAVGLPTSTLAATVTVGDSSAADYSSIDSALAAAGPSEDLTVVLEAGDWPTATVNRAGRTAFVKFDLGGVRLQGVRVTHADAEVAVDRIGIGADGAHVSQGTLSLSGVGFQADSGTPTPLPAIQVGTGATLQASQVLVTGWGGGIAPVVLQPGATATLETFGVFSSSGTRAGAIWSQDATLFATTFYAIDTSSPTGTGALELDGGAATLADCDFDTVSGALAGGIRVLNDATLSGQDLVFMDNTGTAGAAVRLESGDISLIRSFARGGSADQGGVLWMDGGTAEVRNADWSDNRAVYTGGSIHQSNGALTVAYATWTEPVASDGAGIYASGGSTDMSGVIITDTEGSAITSASTGAVSFTDGFVWNIGADLAIEGAVTYSVNQAHQDPAFLSAQRDDFALTLSSPALDLGIGGLLDPDGTASDAGMYGGPEAWALADVDGDGFVYGRDCNDTRDDVHEGAVDVFYDGIDANCDGASDFDQDGDGFDATSYAGADCDDTDAAVYPDASEGDGDGIDANCDGFDYADSDGDGWPADLDCDDDNAETNPGAEDAWYDGIDADCAGNDDFDQDGDGYRSAERGGDDCDDTNPRQHPGYPDSPGDGIDQDCNGRDAQAQPQAEDEVETLSPASPEPEAPEDARPLLSTQATTGGCSTLDSSHAGAIGLILLGLIGLAGRRRRLAQSEG